MIWARAIRRVWLVASVLLAIVGWTFATPLMAAPDEPHQTINAAAVVRGQLNVAPHPGPVGEVSTVRVPAYIAATPALPCYAFKPSHPADCPAKIGTSTALTDAPTQFSNYPPLYFFLVGLPSLWMSGPPAIYAMRLVSALLSGLLIGISLQFLARYRRRTLVGAVVALTPMVFFFSGVISDSSLEIAAGFATWCSLVLLAGMGDERIPRPLLVWSCLSAVAWVLSRPATPAYFVVALVVCAVAARRRVRQMLADREMRIFLLVGLAVIAVAALTLMIDGEPRLLGVKLHPQLSAWGAIRYCIVHMGSQFRGALGWFGWLDTPAPGYAIAVWVAAGALLVLVALARSARTALALGVLAAASFLLPLALEASQVNAVGAYWQGRYWLPLLVGIPLVASSALPELPGVRFADAAGLSRAAKGTAVVSAVVGAGALLTWAQIGSFLRALERYRVGLGRPASAPVSWNPPGGALLVTLLFVIGYCGLIAWVATRLLVARSPAARSETPGPTGTPAYWYTGR